MTPRLCRQSPMTCSSAPRTLIFSWSPWPCPPWLWSWSLPPWSWPCGALPHVRMPASMMLTTRPQMPMMVMIMPSTASPSSLASSMRRRMASNTMMPTKAQMVSTEIKAPMISARPWPKVALELAGRSARCIAKRDTSMAHTSVSKWAASVMMASEFARYPPTISATMNTRVKPTAARRAILAFRCIFCSRMPCACPSSSMLWYAISSISSYESSSCSRKGQGTTSSRHSCVCRWA
mmetsp:Transcript_28415/g.71364  ORF Transcript_28415/g.71364 Transcript_28415/m.71364 type:complete len:236 (-) Transcript_28415:180-887(-)